MVKTEHLQSSDRFVTLLCLYIFFHFKGQFNKSLLKLVWDQIHL